MCTSALNSGEASVKARVHIYEPFSLVEKASLRMSYLVQQEPKRKVCF